MEDYYDLIGGERVEEQMKHETKCGERELPRSALVVQGAEEGRERVWDLGT